jgi:glycosyltransferase involved in cell wall biosynthesis
MTGSNENRRKVLIIAGEFPPLKTIGRIRSVKFSEHLNDLGWDCTVLTVEASGREPNFDPQLDAEVSPHTRVVRVPLETFDERITRTAKRLLGRPQAVSQQTGGNAPASADAPARATAGAPQGRFEGLQHRVKDWIRMYLDVPDSHLPWAWSALPVAREICRREKIDVVFTTLPPFSAAYVGYRLAKDDGIPWIADYRDLWYGDVLREWVPGWRKRVELMMEKRFLKYARAVVTVSEQKTQFMRKLHPSIPARWETLTNGYDAELYENRGRSRPFESGRIEFVYTGRLFKNRRGYAFAEALGRIKRQDPALVSGVRVRIFGGVSPEIARRYREILDQYALNDHFDFVGDVGYQEAMDAQVNCDYLLLIVDTGETSDGVIPGKLFEYVASQRPIFALCDPGATQQIIENADLGVVVGAEDVAQCEAALRKVLSAPVPRVAPRDQAYLARFDRRVITRHLATLLEEVAGPRA